MGHFVLFYFIPLIERVVLVHLAAHRRTPDLGLRHRLGHCRLGSLADSLRQDSTLSAASVLHARRSITPRKQASVLPLGLSLRCISPRLAFVFVIFETLSAIAALQPKVGPLLQRSLRKQGGTSLSIVAVVRTSAVRSTAPGGGCESACVRSAAPHLSSAWPDHIEISL